MHVLIGTDEDPTWLGKALFAVVYFALVTGAGFGIVLVVVGLFAIPSLVISIAAVLTGVLWFGISLSFITSGI
jgi:hypothetical protein